MCWAGQKVDATAAWRVGLLELKLVVWSAACLVETTADKKVACLAARKVGQMVGWLDWWAATTVVPMENQMAGRLERMLVARKDVKKAVLKAAWLAAQKVDKLDG